MIRRNVTAALGLFSVVFLSDCGLLPRFSSEKAVQHHAFIAYWPPKEGDQNLRLAIKDNIDVKGVTTTAGSEYLFKHGRPAKKDATCLSGARQHGVTIVGKTNLSEFALSPSGYNEYFGTPRSPLKESRKLIPGGSSCGSAVAVARGYADVSFGTDTAGSVRVPAACCGVVGLKTTKGLVPLNGIYPVEPQHLDTVGPLARDIAHTAQGMDLLESGFIGKYEEAKGAKPNASGIRVGRLRLKGTNKQIDRAVDEALAVSGFQVVELGEDFAKRWETAKEDGYTVAAGGAWNSDKQYQSSPQVAPRTKAVLLAGRLDYPDKYRAALAHRAVWQRTLKTVFTKVDFIALPTLQDTPPAIPVNLRIGILELFILKLQNTAPVNFAGNPALAMPIPLRHDSVSVTSLQLVGKPKSEAELLNAGRLVEASVKRNHPWITLPHIGWWWEDQKAGD
jgi:amidase